jgi:Terminase RNaseH-like domain
MRAMTQRWLAASAKIVEDKANGPAIIDALRNELSGIVPMSPQGSKLARAQAAAPELEAGNYWLPQAQWAEEFIEECAAFPNAAHDDTVDAWSQAASRFRNVFKWDRGVLQRGGATQRTSCCSRELRILSQSYSLQCLSGIGIKSISGKCCKRLPERSGEFSENVGEHVQLVRYNAVYFD